MARAAQKSATGAKRGNSKAKEPARVDLSGLDQEELLQLELDVKKALKTYEKRRRDDALLEMEQVAQKHGIALKDIMQDAPKRAPRAPKYRHPENPALTWSGRGRQPTWFREAIEAGTSRDDLLIT